MRRGALAFVLLASGFVGQLLVGFAFHALDSESPATSKAVANGYRGSKPPPGLKAPDISLRDYHGRMIRLRSFRGKIVLVTFLDTACTTTCPIVAAAVGSGLRLLNANERAEVVPLAISVDPPKDTPRRIHSFLASRHALALDYLVAPTKQMRPIWKAFGVLSAASTGNPNLHSSDVRIFDRRGRWVSTLHAIVDLTPANLVHDLRLAAKEGASG